MLREISIAWSEFSEALLSVDAEDGLLRVAQAYGGVCSPWYQLIRSLNAYRAYLLHGGREDAELRVSRPRIARFAQRLQEQMFDRPLRLSHLNRQRQLAERDLAKATSGDETMHAQAHQAFQELLHRMDQWRRDLDPVLSEVAELTSAESRDVADLILESGLRARTSVPGLQITVEEGFMDRLGRRRHVVYESLADLHNQDRSVHQVYPIFPPRRVFDAVAKSAVHLPLLSGWPAPADFQTVVEVPGDFVEHLTAGLQMAALHYHALLAYSKIKRSTSDVSRQDGLPSVAANGFQNRAFPGVSREHKNYVVSSVGDAWLDVTHVSRLASEPVAERANLLTAVCGYIACQLEVLAGEALRARGLDHGSAAVKLLEIYDAANAGASLCAQRTLEVDFNTTGSEALVQVAQRGISRAGLFLGERPAVWQGQREELLRDVTLPFLLASGAASAEGEAAVYSGKSDVHFRLAPPLGDERHRGIVEFKKWDGIGSFRTTWDQLIRQHSSGTESYLAAVMLCYQRDIRQVVEKVAGELKAHGISVAMRFKGAGTLAGVDGEVSVRDSEPIPFGVYVFDLAFANPRRSANNSGNGTSRSGSG